MSMEEIYVTYGKSIYGEVQHCTLCRRRIKTGDNFFKFSIRESPQGPVCRQDECGKEATIRQTFNDAVSILPDARFDVDAAVRKVLEYDKRKEAKR